MTILHITPSDNLSEIINKVKEPATIFLKNGIYNQKVKIIKDDVTLIGEDKDKTIITFDDYAKKPHADGREYNTFRTYTVCVTGERVTLKNLTVENSNTAPEKVGQCVALSVNAKQFKAENVALRSTQDTLFTSPFPDDLVVRYSGLTDDPTYYNGFIPRDELYMEGSSLHLFENCEIYGTVDFIFGCAEAYFKNCKLISLGDKRGHGYVTAPAHSLKQERGYTFVDCDFVSEGAEDGSVHLGRPWRDYGKCDFINCRLGSHISPDLFDKWNDTFRNNTARFGFYNLTASSPLAPVPWGKQLTASEAQEIIVRCDSYFAK
jgi:pectinesterase